MVGIKRVYEEPSKEDGFRILVDRMWPRGLSKEDAEVDLWLKDIAPSDELRKWFSHDPDRWEDFKKRYGSELDEKGDQLKKIEEKKKENDRVTLLYAAKDEEHNNAVVLKDHIEGMIDTRN